MNKTHLMKTTFICWMYQWSTEIKRHTAFSFTLHSALALYEAAQCSARHLKLGGDWCDQPILMPCYRPPPSLASPPSPQSGSVAEI